MSSYMQKTAAANRLRKLAAASRVVRKYRRIEKIAGTTGALIGAGAGAGLGAGGGYLLARAINAKKPYIWALGGGGVGALGGAGIGALLGNKKTDSGKAPSKGTSPSKSSPAVSPKEKKTRAPGGNSGSYNGLGPITLAPDSHVIPSEQRKKYIADIDSLLDIGENLRQQSERRKKYTGPSEVEFASSELANPEEPDQQSERRKKYTGPSDAYIDSWGGISEKLNQQSERRKKYIDSWVGISEKLYQQAEDKKRLEENLRHAAEDKKRLEENLRHAAEEEQTRMRNGVDEAIPYSIIAGARESTSRYPESNDPAFPNAARILDLWEDPKARLYGRWGE